MPSYGIIYYCAMGLFLIPQQKASKVRACCIMALLFLRGSPAAERQAKNKKQKKHASIHPSIHAGNRSSTVLM